MARELGVRYVLEGSVRKAGHRVRISGQLIDTATGAHIWGDHFDGSLDDIFELQDQVASSVAGVIEPKLRLAEIERAGRKPTDSLDAYDLYLRARGADIQKDQRKRSGDASASASVSRTRSRICSGHGDDQRMAGSCSGRGTGYRPRARRSTKASAWRGKRSRRRMIPGC